MNTILYNDIILSTLNINSSGFPLGFSKKIYKFMIIPYISWRGTFIQHPQPTWAREYGVCEEHGWWRGLEEGVHEGKGICEDECGRGRGRLGRRVWAWARLSVAGHLRGAMMWGVRCRAEPPRLCPHASALLCNPLHTCIPLYVIFLS